MGLVLTLKPQERIILGGTVIRNNSAHSTHLMVETHTPILRCPDILPESKSNSPCSRIYLAIELLYIQPERREETMRLYLDLTRDLVAAASSMAPRLEEVSRLVVAGDYYKALQKMKRLLRYEKYLLSAAQLPASCPETHLEVTNPV
ncbi:MAG: flagellar biosynthesis repressor FlbT [Bryobacteraceae bacterium]|jgi:flagellar protein FlbT